MYVTLQTLRLRPQHGGAICHQISARLDDDRVAVATENRPRDGATGESLGAADADVGGADGGLDGEIWRGWHGLHQQPRKLSPQPSHFSLRELRNAFQRLSGT